jgi:hypothetical protein
MTDLRIRELGIIATDRRGFQGKNLPLEVIVPDGFAVELATHIHAQVAAWIEAEEVRVLKVAGNRESTGPGIGEQVERFLVAVFGRPGGR